MKPIVIVAIVIVVIIVLALIIGLIVYLVRRKKNAPPTATPPTATPPPTPGTTYTLTPASSLVYSDLMSLENAIIQQMAKLQKTSPPPNPFPSTYAVTIQSYIDTLKASIISASNGTPSQQAEYQNNKFALITTVAYLKNIVQQINARNSQTLSDAMSTYDQQIQSTINGLLTQVSPPS